MFFLLKRLLEYLRYANIWVYLRSGRNQRIKAETNPINMVVTYGMDQAVLKTLISILLLLLSCLLSIQAILYLLDEAPQCVDYCDDCLKNHFADKLYDTLQQTKPGHKGTILPQTVTELDGAGRTGETLPELGDCPDRSCSRQVPAENIKKETAKCEVCGQENCTRCKRNPHKSELAKGTTESKKKQQQCPQCGNLATRCSHML